MSSTIVSMQSMLDKKKINIVSKIGKGYNRNYNDK